MSGSPAPIRIGCAGWSLPRDVQHVFGDGASHLQRYATRFSASEINSTFHRSHAKWVFERWAASVPEHFRFSVKVPRLITHDRRLVGCEDLLASFFRETEPLAQKLACVLVQLPPSAAFDAATVSGFLGDLRASFPGACAVEPRHASWFTLEADALLARHRVARVLADPVRHDAGRLPGGWPRLVYLRLHGSPRMYYSAYARPQLAALADRLRVAQDEGHEIWCIFDNTASGAAASDALSLLDLLGKESAS